MNVTSRVSSTMGCVEPRAASAAIASLAASRSAASTSPHRVRTFASSVVRDAIPELGRGSLLLSMSMWS